MSAGAKRGTISSRIASWYSVAAIAIAESFTSCSMIRS